jgi:hypothetical protein
MDLIRRRGLVEIDYGRVAMDLKGWAPTAAKFLTRATAKEYVNERLKVSVWAVAPIVLIHLCRYIPKKGSA